MTAGEEWSPEDEETQDPDEPRAEVFDVERFRLRVMRAMCESCIFRPGNLMHLSPGRLQGMVAATLADPAGHIPCHSTLPSWDPPQEKAAICRGWWEGYAGEKHWAMVLLQAGAVDWWDEPGGVDVTRSEQCARDGANHTNSSAIIRPARTKGGQDDGRTDRREHDDAAGVPLRPGPHPAAAGSARPPRGSRPLGL